MDFKKINITAIVAGITAVLGLFAGVIAFDSRYVKSDDLENTKNEIVGEMRQEIVKNRSVMINSMQREADDLEFHISELESKKKKVPRYLQEKLKQITRQIQELKDD
jgi:Mg2+ and Co2+ transporter CorA